jgi:hypothetical protein
LLGLAGMLDTFLARQTTADFKDVLAEAKTSWADSVPRPKPTDNIRARLKKDADLLKKLKAKVDKFP